MPDQPTIRLNKVLRELNISLDRAVEHLVKEGHEVEARPTTKISQEVYKVLLDEFETDKSKKDASHENLYVDHGASVLCYGTGVCDTHYLSHPVRYPSFVNQVGRTFSVQQLLPWPVANVEFTATLLRFIATTYSTDAGF